MQNYVVVSELVLSLGDVGRQIKDSQTAFFVIFLKDLDCYCHAYTFLEKLFADS